MGRKPDPEIHKRNLLIKLKYCSMRLLDKSQYEILNELADEYKSLDIDTIAAIISKTKLEGLK
jgi:hypothetical protein